IFQTEKQLKEFGDKLPADKKSTIEDALNTLKKAHAEKDLEACKSAIENLNTVFSAAASDMYNQPGNAGQENTGNATDADVTDVDCEEVKDDKK
ncbi:MAG: Hsp70 family protein, partial [Flavobacteriales bacterium]